MAISTASWLRAQFGERDVAADLEVQLELDAALGQQLRAAQHDLLLQLEVGDAVDQQAAGAVVAVVDRDPIALRAQLLGGGQARRAGADDADRLVQLARAA